MIRIENTGAGGFLNPPDHPEHKYSVGSRDFSCSLSSFVEDGETFASGYDNFTEIKKTAQALLDNWTPLPLHHPDTVEWICQVLGYFKDCYASPYHSSLDGRASSLLIEPQRYPMMWIDDHAGVSYIRKFYPDYEPDQAHFEMANWG